MRKLLILCERSTQLGSCLAALAASPAIRARLTPPLAVPLRRVATLLPAVSVPEAHRCDHTGPDGAKTAIRRYGNQHGKFAKCSVCQAAWTWQEAEKAWHLRPTKSPAGRPGSATEKMVPPPLPTAADLEIARASTSTRTTATRPQPTEKSPQPKMWPGRAKAAPATKAQEARAVPEAYRMDLDETEFPPQELDSDQDQDEEQEEASDFLSEEHFSWDEGACDHTGL